MSLSGALAATGGILFIPLLIGWIVGSIFYVDRTKTFYGEKGKRTYWGLMFFGLGAGTAAMIGLFIAAVWTAL